MRHERTILKHLLNSEKYFIEVFPYTEEEYFEDKISKHIFKVFKKIFINYARRLNEIDLVAVLSKQMKPATFKEVETVLVELKNQPLSNNIDYMIVEAENWIKDRALRLGIEQCIDVYEKGEEKGKVVEIIREAVTAGLKHSTGLSYLDSVEERFAFYSPEETIYTGFKPFDDLFGGLTKEAIYLFQAPTGQGKTLSMTSIGASLVKNGKKVYHFSHELSKKAVSKRLDANILEMNFVDIANLSKDEFVKRFKSKIANFTPGGQYVIENYKTGTASILDMKMFIQDRFLKTGELPDAIISDYLGIQKSSRLKRGTPKHEYVQSVCEEFRELCCEFKIPGLSALQSNREGMKIGEAMNLTHGSESIGISFTADAMIGQIEKKLDESMITDPNIRSHYIWTILKTRFGENEGEKIRIGVNKKQQKLISLDNDDMSIDDIKSLSNLII